MDKNRRENKEKIKEIVCAISGGIDSAVAAALLKRADFNVVGVFMRFWSEPGKSDLVRTRNRCCSLEAELRARKVAMILKIPFYVFDFSKEFKERVVDYFLTELEKGSTPNPCVICNKEIKFRLLLEKALKLGADYIATGHYARKTPSTFSTIVKNIDIVKLAKAKDKNKDQSYFLWMLNQDQLKRALFPIGDYTRAEVEKLAKKFNLPVFGTKKSVEICFIQTTINNFLKKYLKEKPGKIVDKKGNVLGQHKGLWFYTIGQRKGIFLSNGPYFVFDKDVEKNLLIVTKKESDLLKRELIAENINWISGEEPRLPLKIKAKIRYKSSFAFATIYKFKEGSYKVLFQKPQRAITPGQSVVFYKGQEVLGGGIISKK